MTPFAMRRLTCTSAAAISRLVARRLTIPIALATTRLSSRRMSSSSAAAMSRLVSRRLPLPRATATVRSAIRCLAIPTAAAIVALPLPPSRDAVAQQVPTSGDSLRLGALQAAAIERDPRARQLDLLTSRSRLRLATLDAEHLPSLSVNAQGQYQSDVPAVPFRLPGGVSVPAPPHDNYDAHLSARQRLIDPATGARRAVERAELAESQARVRSSLFTLRDRVNEAFFSALLVQAQREEIATGITDLEARLQVARQRVELGTALPSESAMLEAEVLRRRQQLAELAARRDAALAVLGDLTGRAVAATDAIAVPDLEMRVRQVRAALGELRDRPEYAQFARSRELLERQAASVDAQDQPRVSAFGRAGYGRPGLNPLASEFDEYWLAGVQVEWTPWSWGTTDRKREELAIQQRIVATEEAAFSEDIRRRVLTDLAEIDRLAGTQEADDAIVALRERILDETRLRFGEGVITSADLVDRETDVLAARLTRATHRVELAQARARFLTLVGVEVR